MRLVFDSAKNLVKLALLGYALCSLIEGLVPFMLGLAQTGTPVGPSPPGMSTRWSG